MRQRDRDEVYIRGLTDVTGAYLLRLALALSLLTLVSVSAALVFA